MKIKRANLSIALCALIFPLGMVAAEPSIESLEKLFAVSNVQKEAEQAVGQIDGLMKSMMEQSISKQTMSPEQTRAFEKMLPKFTDELQKILKEEVSWSKLKAEYSKVYAKNFSQDEVNGLIAFYQSAPGRALLRKMPAVQEECARLAMGRLPDITARLKEVSTRIQRSLQDKTPSK